MATDNLKFEFLRRWTEIGKKLFSDATPAQVDAINMLEQNMRDLEDNWPHGGGTAQSILAIAETTISVDWSGGETSGSVQDLAIAIPADDSFDYYIEWDISGQLFSGTSTPPVNGIDFTIAGQIYEQPPGAGFEVWGFHQTIPAGATAPAADFTLMWASGHANRKEKISTALLGTTAHVQVHYDIRNYGNTNTGTVRLAYSGTLIAIPN